MSYPLNRLQHDIAQVQHEAAGFGTGRLVAEDLVLTVAHVLWRCKADRMAGVVPALDGWQVRLARDYNPGALPSWPFRRGNRVVWHDPARDLALIQLVDPEGGSLRPLLRLRVAAVEGNNSHAVEARGYPRAAEEEGQRYRGLTPALGRMTAGDRHRPLRFGVDSCDLPNQPHADWPGMSGSAALLQDWPDAQTIWLYGVVQEVPANFDGQLRVARLADAWQQDAGFRKLLVEAGADDEDAADPTAVTLPDRERSFGPFTGVPARITSFTGRDAELDRLDAVLLGGKPAAVTQVTGESATRIRRAAVLGLGGIGKTSLAAEYAHRYRDFYAGVWWCPAQTRLGLLTSLARLAGELGAAPEADVERAAEAGLRHLERQRTPFLLIYDNVVSPDIIANLLPASGARVLITSRFSDWGGWAEEVGLDVLSPAEAVAFLQNRAGRQDEVGAVLLAEALGRLPLALDHAAAYCRRTQMRFADYAARAKSLIATAPRGTSYPHSVAATFELAMDEAVEFCPAAEELMAYLAQCGPERIPLALLEGAVADETERDLALLTLTEVSLARRDPFEDGTPAVTVHRLVQAVARARAEVRGTTMPAIERIIRQLLEIYPDDGYSGPVCWPVCVQLTPHVLALHEADSSGSGGAERASLLSKSASYLHGRAAYSRAEKLSRTALAIRERTLGPEHPETARSLNNLATLLRDQGDLSGARPLHERALAIWERTLGPEHPETARSLNNLALLLRDQGDLSGARPLYERALAIREQALGPEHPDMVAGLNNLASLLRDQGNLSGARPLLKRALAVCERALGPEHPETVTIVNNFAGLLQLQGDLSGARPLFEHALAIRERVLGPEHPHTAASLNNLANLLRDQGDLSGAQPLHRRALAIWEQALGPEHPLTARSLNNLAGLLQLQGDLSGARPLFERALAIWERALGPEHPDVATGLNNLARLLRDQGDLSGARPLFERALATRERVLGAEHPLTAMSLDDLADLLQI